jgi:hypothetical protein
VIAVETTLTELAYRRSAGIEVALFWNVATNELSVTVVDEASGDAFGLPAAPERALDVFYHPYAHAAFCGIKFRLDRPRPGQNAETEEWPATTFHRQGLDG